jgi:hypothetical protein
MPIKIIKTCYDNLNSFVYITYKKNGKTYLKTKRKLRGCWTVISNTAV